MRGEAATVSGRLLLKQDTELYDEVPVEDGDTLGSLLAKLFAAQKSLGDLQNWKAKPVVDGEVVDMPMFTPATTLTKVFLKRKAG